ncbi:polycystic kidney disease protein 1-like 2 isoform X3 [Triplophysa rosa]|uniref:polycystic kidney disease protein 1-like 2 isoform X3 n=1 Tax=Triplophysa rosa TaxID=992332 RepID=UPI002545CBAE|nr:polycystic kidney disease protein 1-like 2 isoform X3 [Triplophysa rosa]
MGERLSTVLILIFFNIVQACGQAATGGHSCPEHQQSFQSSCYEFVGLQRSFLRAQAWCEWGGGHLAFIRNDETQQFLQKHMQPEQNWWIGLAPSFDNITLDTKGGIRWLDGSDVIYSNWISKPVLETGCGYISTDSNSHWKMTSDCNKEFYFVCEFELGRSLSCMNHSTFLRCDSDQVIEIQRSFYGRRTPHYCRNGISTSLTSSQEQCGWDSVLDLVSERCSGQQVCLAVTDASSFGEPCPTLGSYLVVEYNCKYKASSVIDRRSADDSEDDAFDDDVHIRHKRKSDDSKEKSCSYTLQSSTNATEIPSGVTITCLNCDTASVADKVKLSINNTDCDKVYWSIEDKSDLKDDCSNAGKKKMNLLKKGSKTTVDIETNKLRVVQEDYLVEAICKRKNQTFVFGSFTIRVDLLNLQSNPLLSITSDLLIEMKDTDQVTELREQLLSNICVALTNSSLKDRDVLMVANAIKNLVELEDEVNSDAQVKGGFILESISYSLASIDLSTANMSELRDAAQLIVESASHILQAFDSKREKNIATYLVNGLDAVQSFMLANKTADLEPAIITAPHISIYANRISPQYIQQAFTIPSINITSATFSLPNLGNNALANIIEPVDVRMTNFLIDPWLDGLTLNSHVSGFSLTTPDGQSIPVEGLPLEIEILLPRPQADLKSTVLDLSSYSTMAINITSQNATLVLKLEPSEELPLNLLLGYQDYPSDSNYVAKVTFPLEANSLVERYTWILKPSELAGDMGLYYLLVRPIVGPGVKSVNASVTITSITAQCIFWKEKKSEWSDSSCRVGPNTTASVTQCLCNHLTFFGSSFFVMPNTVDPSKSAELFSNFAQNPVVVCFIGAIFLAYILVAIWARRKDLQDKVKVKVTVLEDNDPFAEYRYLLKISTGHRIGASPSSRVVVTIQGTEGECEPHHLTDPEKPVFERGAVDLFLLTTPYSLGELQSISLWHDNSGDHPAWYVNSVMVQDMETGEKRHFLCSAWLAADIDECTIERTIPVATDADLKGFSNLFFMKTTTDFCDGHIWYSVVSRPPSSNFTRVQRISCCFSVLLCTMLTSIMFYGIPTDPSDQSMDMGHIELTWSQVMIGIQSSIIVFPVNLLIVGIFRHSRPREKKTKQKEKKKSKSQKTEKEKPFSSHLDQNNITAEFLIKDIQRIIYLFANAMRCSVPNLEKNPDKADINMLLSELHKLIEQQHSTHANDPSSVYWIYTPHLLKQLVNMEGEVRFLGPSGFSRPGSYSQVLLQVQNIKRLLEGHIYAGSFDQHPHISSTTKDKKKSCWNGFPWWFVYVGWLLVAGTSVVSGYFTMLYGLKYGKDRSINWIISIAMSFTESLFFTQPVKVICFAIFFALVVKNINSDDDLVDSLCKKKVTYSEGPDGLRIARRDCMRSYYKPPPPSDIEKIKRNLAKQRKARGLIVEILVFVGFLWMLLVVAYGQRDSNAYYLTQHIRQSFEQDVSESMNYNDVFYWANHTILRNLFGEYPGFITDGNSKRVGSARLRQVRVKRDSCKIAKPMRDSVPDCNAPYSWDDEDMGSYDPDWREPNSVNGSVDTVWSYQSQSALRGYPVWGDIALYRGGGYVVDLGADKENASSKLQYLFDSTWLDTFTRAIIVEFTVYNANVNLFCLVTLMLERTAVGAFQYRSVIQSVRVYQSTGGFQSFLIASQVFYFLFVCYYMFVQGKLMKTQKWAYFKNKWNLLDLFIIILSWTTLSAIIKRTVLGDRDITYYQNNKDQFPSFHDTALADTTLGYLLAFLVLMASVKLWHLLRLNPKLHLITASLQRAWKDMSSFIMVIAIVFVAYSLACNLIFGWKLYSYRSLPDAFKTIFNLQFGLFNYDEVMDSNPVLGALIITSCVIFLTFVILTLFVSVILEAFSEEQENHQPSEEQEYVDLIIMKFLGLFGIKCKKKEADDKECLLTDDTN